MGLDAELDELVATARPAAPAEVVRLTDKVGAEVSPKARAPHPQWERCRAWISEGLEGSLLKLSDIEAMVADGRMTLWPGRDSAVVTEIMDYTGGDKAMQCVSAGGKIEELVAMTAGIEAAARAQGCSETLIEGRRGWERALKATGYVFRTVTLRKAL